MCNKRNLLESCIILNLFLLQLPINNNLSTNYDYNILSFKIKKKI